MVSAMMLASFSHIHYVYVILLNVRFYILLLEWQTAVYLICCQLPKGILSVQIHKFLHNSQFDPHELAPCWDLCTVYRTVHTCTCIAYLYTH